MPRKTTFGLSVAFICALVSGASGEQFDGRIVEVRDGVSLRISGNGVIHEVLLFGVACPKLDEPHGTEVQGFTRHAALGKDASVEVIRRNENGQILGRLTLPDGMVLNDYILQQGMGWWDRLGAPGEIMLRGLDSDARNRAVGLWAPRSPQERTNAGTDVVVKTKGSLTGSKPMLVLAVLIPLIALAGTLAFFILKSRSQVRTETKAPDLGQLAIKTDSTQEETEAIASSKQVIQELIKTLAESIGELIENNAAYSDKMGKHKASIRKATTLAELEAVEKLLLSEIEEIQSSSRHYRSQLDHANVRLREQEKIIAKIQIESKMDFLTKIGNRRALDDRLIEEFARAKRHGRIFSLIMIDIDRFKLVNDKYGHLAGDKALQVVAHIMKQRIRVNDSAYRYGGEEFAVLLPETSAHDSRVVANNVRETIKRTTLKYEESKIHFTISAGVGQADPEHETPASLLKRIDAALYQAKQNGRDRVEMAQLPAKSEGTDQS